MKTLALVSALLVAGCLGDDDVDPSQHCEVMKANITQRAGTCFLVEDETGNCPPTIGTLCNGDGDPLKCPSESDGWSTECEQDQFGNPVTCRYKGTCGHTVNNIVEYDYIQTYNGTDGMLIDTGNSCEFRECLDQPF